jgi:hypothetical protein
MGFVVPGLFFNTTAQLPGFCAAGLRTRRADCHKMPQNFVSVRHFFAAGTETRRAMSKLALSY